MGASTSAFYLTLPPFHPPQHGPDDLRHRHDLRRAHIRSHGRLAAITVIVVMVTASLDPSRSPGLNALLRFAESCIGTAVTVLGGVLWPESPAP